MVIGAAIVLTYTTFGGMLSVAFLDFVQMMVIMGGLLYIGWVVSRHDRRRRRRGRPRGYEAGKFDFFPEARALRRGSRSSAPGSP